MSPISNREVRYNFTEYIEHRTGKRVRSFQRLPQILATAILFTDGSEALIREGYGFDDHFDIEPIKRFCASCGEAPHASEMDWQGRCSTAVKNFWEKVRKVYWHRYIQSK